VNAQVAAFVTVAFVVDELVSMRHPQEMIRAGDRMYGADDKLDGNQKSTTNRDGDTPVVDAVVDDE